MAFVVFTGNAAGKEKNNLAKLTRQKPDYPVNGYPADNDNDTT